MQNVFRELNGLFLRMQKRSYKYDIYDNILISEVIYLLREEAKYWEKELHSPSVDFRYAFTLPTYWAEEIRDKLIRPLFIQAGLINNNDHRDRLLFFTELQSIFRFFQDDSDVEQGQLYILCTLDYNEEVCVNMELISAQYPPLKATEKNYVPQLLKSVQFTIPFKLKERKQCIKTSLEKRCTTRLTTKLIDILALESDIREDAEEIEREHDSNGSYRDDNKVIHSKFFFFLSYYQNKIQNFLLRMQVHYHFKQYLAIGRSMA